MPINTLLNTYFRVEVCAPTRLSNHLSVTGSIELNGSPTSNPHHRRPPATATPYNASTRHHDALSMHLAERKTAAL